MIFYFSGVGNSAWVAERLARTLDQDNGIPAGIYASKSWLYNNLDMGELPYTVCNRLVCGCAASSKREKH